MAPPHLRVVNLIGALGFWAVCASAAGADAAAKPAAPSHSASRFDKDTCAWADRIGARYGSADFPKVESIRFTVRETRGGEETVRHWIWFPKSDSVYFQGPDPKGLELQAGYSRKNKWSLSSETVAGIDRMFARDRVDLLFPVLFSRDRVPAMRIGEGGWLLIAYPREEGDHGTYEVLADSDGTILAWKAPGYATGSAGTRFEWAAPKRVDGLPLSLERTGANGSKTRFTDLKIIGIKR
jgi:hypothetical protein